MLCLSTITIPFNIKNKIALMFTKISQFTFVIIAYLIIVLFVEMFEYNKHYVPKANPKYVPFKFEPITFFKYYGNFIYAFNCIGKCIHLHILLISEHLRDEEPVKKEK